MCHFLHFILFHKALFSPERLISFIFYQKEGFENLKSLQFWLKSMFCSKIPHFACRTLKTHLRELLFSFKTQFPVGI